MRVEGEDLLHPFVEETVFFVPNRLFASQAFLRPLFKAISPRTRIISFDKTNSIEKLLFILKRDGAPGWRLNSDLY